MKVALTIAGTDSGGGAGIAADLKTFEAHGVWGTMAVVAVTAQNTVGVQEAFPVPVDLVRRQIDSVVSDIGVDAAKTGMLATAGHVRAVAAAAPTPLVVDPVLLSKHGARLLRDDAVTAVRDDLAPKATVITPNLPEAEALTGLIVADRAGMLAAGRALLERGPAVVMVKGGHLPDDEDATDLVIARHAEPLWLDGPRIRARHTHGTGCVLSAAITAELARGMEPVDACIAAKRFVEKAIAAGVELGAGVGPVNPGWERDVRGG